MVIFDNAQRMSFMNLQNMMYTWSRTHNIIFLEQNTLDGLKICFGRPEELTVFLLTWNFKDCMPTVIRC